MDDNGVCRRSEEKYDGGRGCNAPGQVLTVMPVLLLLLPTA